MKRCVQTDIVFLIMELLTGEEERTIEAAKRLIAHSTQLDPELLTRVIADSGYKPWSKAMSAYVLGFVPMTEAGKHQLILREVLADRGASVRLRAHAAEALGNLNDEGAVQVLRERLLDEGESSSVRRWCIYALGELRSSTAADVLKSFASMNPRGALAQELESVGIQSL